MSTDATAHEAATDGRTRRSPRRRRGPARARPGSTASSSPWAPSSCGCGASRTGPFAPGRRRLAVRRSRAGRGRLRARWRRRRQRRAHVHRAAALAARPGAATTGSGAGRAAVGAARRVPRRPRRGAAIDRRARRAAACAPAPGTRRCSASRSATRSPRRSCAGTGAAASSASSSASASRSRPRTRTRSSPTSTIPTTEYLRLPFLDFVAFNVYLEDRERARRLPRAAAEPRRRAAAGARRARARQPPQRRSTQQAEALARQLRSALRGRLRRGVRLRVDRRVAPRRRTRSIDWDFGLTDRERRPEAGAAAAVATRSPTAPLAPPTTLPRVSVVVCTLQRRAHAATSACEALTRARLPRLRGDRRRRRLDRRTARRSPRRYDVALIRTDQPRASAPRATRACAAATGEIVAYIDDDALPDPHWLDYLALALRGRRPRGRRRAEPPAAATTAPSPPASPTRPAGRCTCCSPTASPSTSPAATWRSAASALRGDRRLRPAVPRRRRRRRRLLAPAGARLDARLPPGGGRLASPPRDACGGFWRQQRGYGRAEALLERKWPEKYNVARPPRPGRGRLYGRGRGARCAARASTTASGAPARSSRRSPRAERGSARARRDAGVVPRAAGAGARRRGSAAAGAPLLRRALPLLPSRVALLLGSALAGGAARATSRLARRRRAAAAAGVLTALLHAAPAAGAAAPAGSATASRRGGAPRARLRALPLPARRRVWLERWRAAEDRVGAARGGAARSGLRVRRGGAFDRWDLEVRAGRAGGVRVRSRRRGARPRAPAGARRIWPRAVRWRPPSRPLAALARSRSRRRLARRAARRWARRSPRRAARVRPRGRGDVRRGRGARRARGRRRRSQPARRRRSAASARDPRQSSRDRGGRGHEAAARRDGRARGRSSSDFPRVLPVPAAAPGLAVGSLALVGARRADGAAGPVAAGDPDRHGARQQAAAGAARLPRRARARTSCCAIAVVAGSVVTALQHGAGGLDNYVNTKLDQSMVLDLRSDLFQHAQRLSLAFHDSKRTGKLMYQINNQASAVGADHGRDPAAAAERADARRHVRRRRSDRPELALLSLTVVPFIYYSAGYYARRIEPRVVRRAQRSRATSLSIVHEAMAMLRVIVAFGRERHEYRASASRARRRSTRASADRAPDDVLAGRDDDHRDRHGARARLRRLPACSRQDDRRRAARGDGLHRRRSTSRWSRSATRSARLQQQFITLRGALDLLDTRARDRGAPGRASRSAGRAGRVAFERVSFTYAGRKRHARATSPSRSRRRSASAIVGPTGAGKSTL